MDGVARLPADDRAAMFEEAAARRRLANAGIVEKDFWVCWTLCRLHSIPKVPRLLFKGGTSLSKCFGLTYRFSEDIDLGIEREDIPGLSAVQEVQCLLGKLDPASGTSRKAYERAVEALKLRVQGYIADTLFPLIEGNFREALGEKFVLHPPEPGAEEPTILFEYPRALSADAYGAKDYVQSVVKLELGARSDHEPVRTTAIRSYAAEEFESEFQQPECNVVAQAPERTLLEKALILHAAIHRGSIKSQSSRHAYDLAMMNRDASTMAAVSRGLYERVAYHKFVYGETSAVRDAPKNGIRLVPEGDVLRELAADYGRMEPMLFTEPAAPRFAEVLAELHELQATLCSL
ncbi:MAG: nucleotidyl transferase AbiEii/AbiGii toxin family protein [Planctomycetaceae bacterium]|nr:nucleotidyl transferase AbiEii/AbiGii toxin family protein [Planctomycetaceae bacterium]